MSNQDINLILGSSSKWRKEVIEEMGYKCRTISPDIDEKAIRDPDARVLTLKIAKAKAEAVLPQVKEPAIVVTSDQVIVWNGQIREKPENAEEARTFLRSYKDHPAECVAAVYVINTANGVTAEGVDVAYQHFHPLPEDVIEKLIEQGDVMYCAGGFTIEHMDGYLKKLDGEKETVMGLPKSLTKRLIDQVR